MCGNHNKIFGLRFLIISVLAFFLIVLVPVSTAFAQTQSADAQQAKDSDLDGVSDDAEINTYKTNPNEPDSDNDKVLDYQEILDGTNPNDPNSNFILLAQNANQSFSSRIDWYISRISGITAFVLFTFVICLGLMMTSKATLKVKRFSPAQFLEKHQLTATFLAFSLVLLHFMILFFDQTIKLKPIEAFVPLLLKRDFNSVGGYNLTWTIALGIIAFYLALVLIITSNYRNRIVSHKTWRAIHYSSFLFFILIVLHGFFSGSDSKSWWMILIYLTSVITVISLLLIRIFGKKQIIESVKQDRLKEINKSPTSIP